MGSTIYTPTDLPTILRNMASYAEECIHNGEDMADYYKEILETGLFHDSEGEGVLYADNTFRVMTEY